MDIQRNSANQAEGDEEEINDDVAIRLHHVTNITETYSSTRAAIIVRDNYKYASYPIQY